MNFDLDDNQRQFRETVSRFCAPVDVARRLAIRATPGGLDRSRWEEMAGLGLIALALPENDGGLGGSLIDCAIVAQTMGHGLAVEPWTECAFLPARLLAGTTQAEAVGEGRLLATLAFAEAQGRFNLSARQVTAKNDRLSGEKIMVLCAATADLFIVSAADDDTTSLFLVDRHADGVTIRPYRLVDGSEAGVVSFHNAPAARLGDMRRLEHVIDETRLMAAAEMVGIAERLFEDTLDYVKTREQFGQPIGRFQVIQHRMVDAYARREAIQSSLLRALLQPGQSRAAAKAFIAEGAQWIGEQAIQLHGGMGMTNELAIGHGVKRILLLAKLFGDPAWTIASLAKAA